MRIVIVGAGPAGVTVAETLREHDSQAEIVMLTDEPYPPYSPPAMVTYFETGEPVHFWRGQDLAERLRLVYWRGTRVAGVEPAAHRVRLQGGEVLAYDRLVIASGGRLYAPLAGADKPGVYNFKSLSAAEELLARVRSGQATTALVVGAGFIGVEIGLLLADMGLAVTQLVRSRVMRSMLDSETSALVLAMMQERGIHVLRGDEADAVAFLGEPRAEAVELRSGARLAADLLVAATGLRPNIEFLAGSGIETTVGVIVDDHLRTSDPDIYAAGDVAETKDRFTGERQVHAIFPNAVEQGRVVGLNLLGRDVAYQGAGNMNSLKHLGLPVMAVGRMEGEELRAGHKGTLRKLYLQGGRIIGFRLVGDISCAGVYLSLMNRREDVRALRHRLLEPDFGVHMLAPE
ncbi:MAG TPA: FAD-dependent oxidoreductase [Anaerolineae bacterium]|nr:FAD-dependent oxidoreductase [Anaerolineae bacterium]HOR00649.1 FAD-dependent oxidoreductase [Anaerolineae bacterium]HPL28590.1 FAD-dependent oxidoreductase [Anaerolineae bacterium]